MGEKKLVDEKKTASEIFESLKGHPVAQVRLHTAYEAHGVFGAERTINAQKVRGIKMKYDGLTLWWQKGNNWGFIPGAAINGGVCE